MCLHTDLLAELIDSTHRSKHSKLPKTNLKLRARALTWYKRDTRKRDVISRVSDQSCATPAFPDKGVVLPGLSDAYAYLNHGCPRIRTNSREMVPVPPRREVIQPNVPETFLDSPKWGQQGFRALANMNRWYLVIIANMHHWNTN